MVYMDRLKPKRGSVRRKEETLFSSALRGSALSLLLTLVLAAVLSLFALASDDAETIVFPLALFCIFFGSACGAFAAAKFFPAKSFYAGILSVCLPFAVMLLCSVIFAADGCGSVFETLSVPLSLILGCIAGAFAGSKHRKSTKRMMKKLVNR